MSPQDTYQAQKGKKQKPYNRENLADTILTKRSQ